MNAMQKALWYVESHLQQPMTLEQVARNCSVTPWHLTRAFGTVIGKSLMRYVRSRRLTEAARQLASGATDILTVALDHGYGSHEAFTRAFKEEFHRTPEEVRAQGHFNHLPITEPINMENMPIPELTPPRIETLPPMWLAGLVERYVSVPPQGIPQQWQRFARWFGQLPQISADAWGACFNYGENGEFDYLAGVEVSESASIPDDLKRLNLAEQKYAVFHHEGHIAEIQAVIASIWQSGLQFAGYEAAEAPMLEKYGPDFDGMTGLGGFEIWVAVK